MLRDLWQIIFVIDLTKFCVNSRVVTLLSWPSFAWLKHFLSTLELQMSDCDAAVEVQLRHSLTAEC